MHTTVTVPDCPCCFVLMLTLSPTHHQKVTIRQLCDILKLLSDKKAKTTCERGQQNDNYQNYLSIIDFSKSINATE